jgi:hypothetical protein
MFRNRNTDEVLNQIYDFIKERPNFSKKAQCEKIIDFLEKYMKKMMLRLNMKNHIELLETLVFL